MSVGNGSLRRMRSEIARAYGREAYSVLWRTIELEALLRVAERQELPLAHAVDLDVGCGEGAVTTALTGSVQVGVDLSDVRLRQAEATGTYESVVRCAADEMPFVDGAFASVLCNSVLEHIPDDRSALREMARVTQPGGHLYLTVPSTDFHRSVFRPGTSTGVLQAADDDLQHHHYYDRERLAALFDEAGYDLLDSEPYFSVRWGPLWWRLRRIDRRLPARRLVKGRPIRELARRALTVWLARRLPPPGAADSPAGPHAGIAAVGRRR